MRARLRRRGGGERPPADETVPIDTRGLTGLFAAPGWLRDLGATSWCLVGAAVLLVAAVWLLSLTSTIVMPVITASVIAAVASPVVRWMASHGIPRGVGTGILLLALIALGIGMVLLIVGGITNQGGDLASELDHAKATIEGWLKDLGVDPTTAKHATSDASSSTTSSVSTLLHGVGSAIEGISSLAFFLALTALSSFFLLVDGPTIRGWLERHSGVPAPVAHTVSQRLLQSLRGYFLGVTIVAAYNAVLVFVGALILGVPLAGTIAVITFFAAYIPYLGAWTAGAFAVLIALGGAGTDAAIGMAILQLLANGILQQLVQPFAYGAALGIHPLAVLVVTIGGGALFGAVGLILAAPVTSAVTRISADLGRAREPGSARDGPGPPAAGAAPVPEPAG